MKEYLLSISVGPVQDFIAAARKTRDLAFGSLLLSECSKSCARYLHGLSGASLIFPAAADLDRELKEDTDFAVVNKIMAVVMAENEQGVATIASDCKSSVRQWLLGRYAGMEASLKHRLDPNIRYDGPTANRQMAEVLEFYAAWAELKEYRASRQEVELRLAARKTLRDFAWHEGSHRPKSELDGVRETVVEHARDTGYKRFSLRPGELLDAVGMLKRFGRAGESLRFESTHDVAALPFLRRAEKHAPELLEKYRARMRDLDEQGTLPFSYSHIFHEDAAIKESAIGPAIREVAKPLSDLKPAPPYYGILVGDGDHMGRALTDRDKESHREFSEALSGFAKEVRARFSASKQEPDGELVFAGGDDVVAFVPLHTAIERLRTVRDCFEAAMGRFGATFSAGLAVCHAMDPLSEARDWARQAEVRAKGIDADKAAFCITIVPRSGAPASFRAKWPWLDTLDEVVQLYWRRELTLGLAHELRKLLNEWADASPELRSSLDNSLPQLALEIARKKQTGPQAIRMINRFLAYREGDHRGSIGALTDCLFVARPFARAMKEAQGEAPRR